MYVLFFSQFFNTLLFSVITYQVTLDVDTEKNLGLHTKYLLFLYCFNQNCNMSTDCNKISLYHMS